MSFWIATLHTQRAQVTAFGSTPEMALTVLVQTWIEKHCPFHGDKPELPWTMKDEVSIGEGELNEGYVLAGTDRLWYKNFVQGDSPILADTWAELAIRFNVRPRSRSTSP